MTPQLKAAIRSFLTTFLATLITLVPVTSVVEGEFQWLGPALMSAGLAAVRTLLAALDPGMGLYGVGAEKPPA